MPGLRLPVALALTCSLLPSFAPVAAAAPVPLDYRAYDGWNAVRTPKLSDDGSTIAYAVAPEDGDPTLVVRDLVREAERREPRGSAPQFAGSGRFVVFTHVAAKKDVDAARKAKTPEDRLPKAGAGILDLRAAGPAEIVDNVRTIAVARNGGPVIALRAEPSPAPSRTPAAAVSSSPPGAAVPSMPPTGEPGPALPGAASPQPSRSPSAAGGSAAPSAAASASPEPQKSKEPGSPLTIRDLESGKRVTANDASEVAVSDDDRFVAYATQTRDGRGDGLHVYDAAAGTTTDVMRGAGRYRNLAFARDGSRLAFLSDAATFAERAPRDALYVVDLRAATRTAQRVVDRDAGGSSAASAPSANGTVGFSRDGERIFFGTAAAPTPASSGTPEPMKVDVWTWHDDVLQSQQKHDAERERKRTYLAVYDVHAARFAQLGSTSVRDVERNENRDVALGVDERPYRRAQSWGEERVVDLYAVSLADGAHRRIASGVRLGEGFEGAAPPLSPEGRYALVWDSRLRHWVSVRTSDGRRMVLGARAPTQFWFAEDDHPAPPSPYGRSGWLMGDRGVLLYDRYDVWLADPATGDAANLTRGEGRRTHVVYSPVQTDPDALAIPADAPILLSLFDERTDATGYARVPAGGGVPATLLKLDEKVNATRAGGFTAPLHDLVDPPLAAKHAERYAFTRESLRKPRDLWVANTAFRSLTRVSDINPQQSRYRWGTERLIAFRSATGKPLRAVLYVPDGLAPNRSAPMLVYFYERFSSSLHRYIAPAPGTSPNLIRYVSNGYVVLLPDVAYEIGHPGKSALDAILPAVDAAVKTGYVDPRRVGIAGHSWAAYQINYMITQTHRFRAVEAGAAVDDMISAYSGIRLESGVVREGQYEHGQSRIGATPWDRTDLYLENSGLFHIRSIMTPYLTIHNDLDGAVPQFQGIEFITAMRRLGKEAYLFSFDGEDHNLRGREQQKYWTVHLDEFFDHYLKGAPRPAWMNGVDYLHRGERDVRPLYGESP